MVMTHEELIETGIPGVKLKPGGSINVSGDASIVFKTDGKEVFQLSADSDQPLGCPGTVTPKTKLEIKFNV
jgi:hypothetical protein